MRKILLWASFAGVNFVCWNVTCSVDIILLESCRSADTILLRTFSTLTHPVAPESSMEANQTTRRLHYAIHASSALCASLDVSVLDVVAGSILVPN